MVYLLNFKWKRYIDCNPDLKKNWNGPVRARIHYMYKGFKEGRKISDVKYICLGNPKTGTTSLLNAFKMLGYKTESLNIDMTKEYLEGNTAKVLDKIIEFDFLKEWPWKKIYKEIDKKYPHSKFILTIRNENDWVKSYVNSLIYTSKEFHNFIRPKLYGFDPKEYLYDKDFLIKNIYQKQNEDVLLYFKDRPQDLLIIDVTESGQWDKLCSFIGCKKPKQEFPYANKTSLNSLESTNKVINRYDISKYTSVIKKLPQKFYLVDNIGNWGDALIKKGTLEFFKDMGYEYTFLNIGRGKLDVLKKIDAHMYKDSTVVFMGGGYFCTYWSYVNKTYFDELQKKFKHIIFLPGTYQEYKGNNFLNKLNTKKFTFFRRDNFESKTVIPHSIFAPDFALYIKHVECSTTEVFDKGYIFRGDRESSGLGFVYHNEDVSIFGSQNAQIKGFFEYINQFKEIHTDRLHVAIAGYMMDKKVFLYPGGYRKNKDVYDTYFKNTKHIVFVNKNSFLFYKHRLQNILFFFQNFDSKQYIELNPDLKKNWRSNMWAKIHYLLWGRKEKREILSSFLRKR